MGRRQTFFDGLGTIIFNRDRDIMDIVVRVAVYLVLNIAWAMFFMFWVFIFGLPRLIWTFGATWVCAHTSCLCLRRCHQCANCVCSRCLGTCSGSSIVKTEARMNAILTDIRPSMVAGSCSRPEQCNL